MDDLLVVALATVLEGLLKRGIEVCPCGDGWTIKLAQENRTSTDDPEREHRRSW